MPTTDKHEELPRSPEAEKALLGSVLLDNSALGTMMDVVSREDFYAEGHRVILSEMLELAECGQVIDLVTLSEKLSCDGALQKAGGVAYLASLTDGVPVGSESGVREYARIVKSKSRGRRLINVAQNLIARSLDFEDPDDLCAQGITDLLALDAGEESDFKSFRGFGVSLLEKLGAKSLPRILTGLKAIDDRTGGFQPGELVVIASKTGRGKTLLAQQTRRFNCRRGKHSLYASAEMPGEQLVARDLSSETGVWYSKLRNPELLTQADFSKLTGALQYQCERCMVRHGVLTIAQIASAAKRVKTDGNLEFLVIDYDELISAPGKTENERLAAVATGAWQLAVSLQVPVLLLSQIRKAGADEQAGTTDEVYGSAVKVKSASCVIRIDRDFKREYVNDIQEARIRVLKNRFGDLGDSKHEIGFHRGRLEFVELEGPLDSRLPYRDDDKETSTA